MVSYEQSIFLEHLNKQNANLILINMSATYCFTYVNALE